MSTQRFVKSPFAIRLGFATAAVLLAVTAGAAHAQSAPSMVVRYSDLDITTQHGADALYARIQEAAAEVCPQVTPAELSRYVKAVQCRNQAIERAVESIHSPLLAAVSAAHRHHV
jgi:UrcA family protein